MPRKKLTEEERKAKQRQYNKRYWEKKKNDPEYIAKQKAKSALYYQKNKAKRSAQIKKWIKANPDKVKSYEKKYKSTTECKAKANKRQKERKANDPAYRLRCNIGSAVSMALKRQEGSKQGESTFKHLPYTPEILKEHLEAQFDENMSWDNYGSYWEIDHIYPQSKLLYDNMEHPNFEKCWALSNLRPLEKGENRSKSDKLI